MGLGMDFHCSHAWAEAASLHKDMEHNDITNEIRTGACVTIRSSMNGLI
jgi:hypothetical protein